MDEQLADSSSNVKRDASREVRARRRQRRAQTVIVVALGCGGIVGAIARYAVSLALPTPTGGFPWSTLIINLSGSALLGFLLTLLIEQFPRGRLARPVICTGVIGAFTTFSTFSVDVVELAHGHDYGTAALYLGTTVIAGLVALWLGVAAARVAIRAEQWLQEAT